MLARLKTTPTFDKIKELIDPEDLGANGIEDETHVTLLYGLHDEVNTNDVRECLDGLDLKEIEVTGMSLFQNGDGDVLKLDVKLGLALKILNQALLELPNTQSFDKYIPHVTIAYLKAGAGKKYLPSKKFNYKMEVSEIVFSYPGRTKQENLYETVKRYHGRKQVLR